MITRTAARCVSCGQAQGRPHLRGCQFARFTVAIQCTRCGGAHALSQCPWPLSNK